MINNKDIILPLLQFEKPGDCYFIQILKRRKDNPDMIRDMEVIDSLFIYSVNDFNAKFPSILETCNLYNARAYIRLNRRNTEKLAILTIGKIADFISSRQYEAVFSAYLKIAGEWCSEPDKTWIVDIDDKSLDYFIEIKQTIETLHEKANKNRKHNQYKIIAKIPTQKGFHIITQPFNFIEFSILYPGVDIHKDNPTILYMP